MDSPALSASRRTLRDWVERHPLITFISLAYGISWAALLLAHRIDLGASNAFSVIMSAGPAFAGSLTWALLRPEASGVSARKRWQLFGLLTLLLIALFALRRIWFAAGLVEIVGRVARPIPYPTWAAPITDILGAAATALFLSGVHSPRQGVRDFLWSFDQRRQPLRWYWWLAGIALYPVVVLIGNAVWATFGLALPTPQASGPWYWLAVDAVLFFLYVMIAGGGLEEPGWRGFALPRLQRRFSPLLSSLILAVIWAFWHWPLFWLGYSEGGPFAVVLYALGAMPLAILLTAAFNRSGGSLPVVILMHTSFNITSVYLPASTLATGLWMLLILIIAAWMWRSPQTFSFHPAEIREIPAATGLMGQRCMTTYQISRQGLLDWVRAHELLLFFALAFLLSWTIYGVLAMIEVPNNTTLSRLELIAAYGPSLSAILLSATTARAAHKQAPGLRWVLFLGIVPFVIGTEWLDHIWWRHPIDASVIGADIVLIALAIFVAFRMTVDRVNPPEMSAAISWWRANWRWCLVALGLWPALIAAGNFIADTLSLSQPAAPSLPAVPLLLLVLESFAWYLLFGGPLNEEPGWRGFALPRLCRRFSPLVASIILGALWGLWHVPLHFMGAYYGGPLGAIIRIQEIPRAVLFTWLYNRTNGSLLLVLLFHAAINTTGLFLSRSYLITLILCMLLAAFVIVLDRMWLKKPST